MTENWLELTTPDGPMDAFVVANEGAPPRGAVIVIQEAFGVNAHIQDVTRRVAGEGYVAIAPDLFHRHGRRLAFGYDEFPKLRPIFQSLTNDGIAMDLSAALAHLRGRKDVDGERVGVVGFCVGGFAAFLAACRLGVRTAVAFYGGGIAEERPGVALRPLLDEAKNIKGSVLAFFGNADSSIPKPQVDAIRTALEAAHVRHEIVAYPGAQHGFFCEVRASYHEKAAKDAWERTKAWFARELKG